MSHVATVEIVIQDLEALKAACKEIGLEFKENQKTYKWYGTWVNDYNATNAAYRNGIDPKDYGKCVHAISVPGNNTAYEIGLVARPDGGYNLVWDFWQGGQGLEKIAGKDNCNLTEAYVKNVSVNKLTNMGYCVEQSLNDQGEVVLTATRY